MFRYKEFRKAHGLFQSQLADIIGMAQSNVSRYENEGIDPTPEQYKKLYDKYGKEDVDSYRFDDMGIDVKSIINSITKGQGGELVPSNGVVEILKRTIEVLANHMVEQDKINARLMAVLENLTIK